MTRFSDFFCSFCSHAKVDIVLQRYKVKSGLNDLPFCFHNKTSWSSSYYKVKALHPEFKISE
jgi:hypothetical protein